MPAVTIRYYAAAGAAAGITEEQLVLSEGSTFEQLLDHLRQRHGERLEQVLLRCSYLLDEIAVRDTHRVLPAVSTLDVLPPFAGG